MTTSPYISGFIFLMFFIPAYNLAQNNQDSLILDIAGNDPGSIITVQGNLDYSYIILENSLAFDTYNIIILTELEMLDPLNFEPFKPHRVAVKPKECGLLSDKVEKLADYQSEPGSAKNEKELAKLVQEVKKEIKKKSCTDDTHLKEANRWIESTKRRYKKAVKVNSGEKVTISITRDSLVWTFVYLGKQRGRWVTYYGFSFTFMALEKETYFSKEVTGTSTYEISKCASPKPLDLNYIPTVFFSYFPTQNFSKAWNHSITAGLGFDLTAPSVFFGYNGTFWHNIGISLGLALQQQYSLKSQYSEYEIITQNLDKDQLHDKVYRPNAFFSINFRFGENPFTNSQSNTEE